MPAELSLVRAIEQFGVKAVMGRDTLTAQEITALRISGALAELYRRRETAPDGWASWTEKYPKEAAILDAAQRIWQNQSK